MQTRMLIVQVHGFQCCWTYSSKTVYFHTKTKLLVSVPLPVNGKMYKTGSQTSGLLGTTREPHDRLHKSSRGRVFECCMLVVSNWLSFLLVGSGI